MKYKHGDVLVNKYGKRKVLAVCGDVYVLSASHDLESCGIMYTQKDIDDNAYTLLVTCEYCGSEKHK